MAELRRVLVKLRLSADTFAEFTHMSPWEPITRSFVVSRVYDERIPPFDGIGRAAFVTHLDNSRLFGDKGNSSQIVPSV